MNYREYRCQTDPCWPPLNHSWPETTDNEEFEAWLDECISKDIQIEKEYKEIVNE